MLHELARDALPAAFHVHCLLEVEAPSVRSHKNVSFEPDDGETGCWVTKVITTDECGPTHIIYFESYIEVHRYWSRESDCPELAARIDWDDPDVLAKVLTTATRNMLLDWS